MSGIDSRVRKAVWQQTTPLLTVAFAILNIPMKLFWITIGSVGLLSACSTSGAPRPNDFWTAEAPSEQLVDYIEARLANDPCVGNMEQWARFYEWSLTPLGIDTGTVEIDLREAGAFGFASGRQIRARDPSLGPGQIKVTADDRDYRVAFASFHIATKELELHSCSENRNEGRQMSAFHSIPDIVWPIVES